MHARQRILINEGFKDGIEIDMKWVVTGFLKYSLCNAFTSVLSKFQIGFKIGDHKHINVTRWGGGQKRAKKVSRCIL
jgi:hypothetical protein